MAGRQFGLYFAWSRPQEINVSLDVLNNRYPALFEFRRLLWPHFEDLSDPGRYDQGIEGFLDNVILADFRRFRDVIARETGSPVRLLQREGADPHATQLDQDLFSSIDTLIVPSLDHMRTAQDASPSEVELLREFLSREDHCVVLCPHHDIGNTDTLPPEEAERAQQVEHVHHGDLSIPGQQRFGQFARSLLRGLGFTVENQYGLRPATAVDGSPAAIDIDRNADGLGILSDVTTFNLHPHLPHYAFTSSASAPVEVLARQAVDPAAPPHPFTEAGSRHFNAMLRAGRGTMAGKLLVCDATLFSSAFGGLPSLERFWRNLANLPRKQAERSG